MSVLNMALYEIKFFLSKCTVRFFMFKLVRKFVLNVKQRSYFF